MAGTPLIRPGVVLVLAVFHVQLCKLLGNAHDTNHTRNLKLQELAGRMLEVVQQYIDDPRARIDAQERLGRAARRIRCTATPSPGGSLVADSTVLGRHVCGLCSKTRPCVLQELLARRSGTLCGWLLCNSDV